MSTCEYKLKLRNVGPGRRSVDVAIDSIFCATITRQVIRLICTDIMDEVRAGESLGELIVHLRSPVYGEIEYRGEGSGWFEIEYPEGTLN